jgi:hypothetical protein
MSKVGTRALVILTMSMMGLALLLVACGGTSAISTSVAVVVGTSGAATPGSSAAGTPARPGGITIPGVGTPGGITIPGIGTPGGITIPGIGAGTPVVPGPLATTAAGLQTAIPLPSGNFGIRTGNFQKKIKDGSGQVQVLAAVVNLGLDFNVTNGANLHVYLTKEASPNNQAEVERGFVDLGALTNTRGLSFYPIPNGTDVNAYKGVIIYSVNEKAVYIAATLSNP